MSRPIIASALAVAAALLLSPALRPDAARADHHEKHEMKDTPEKLLRHVVLFKFKDTATEADVTEIEEAFAALPEKIDAVHDFEYGVNNSPEGLDRGYTHCFLVTFKSEEDRATYLPHPAHLAFVEVLKPHLDAVHVIDYWTK